ncbi:MAG: AAA family ATPase [Giesbergeria sp.]|uniref:AAA family ATPase n=1 Tax=Giesbergeria sp. TaxID=2818473 RepID=UPI0026330D55|nr:AAA family ATPase [Giesbergeria sp.]MDD2610950.1 AAA family ATPase [Giesbergeria sp.]
MILTVANTKGGVGKTTLSVNIAAARALAGRDVWLLDGDRQATAQSAMTIRAQQVGNLFGLAYANYHDGSLLKAQLQLQAEKFDDVVIDVGGRDSTSLRAALLLSDAVLIPVQPRSFDVWALSDMTSLIAEVRKIREGLRCFAVLNFADPGASKDNIEAAAAIADFPELEYLPTPLGRRKAFATAASLGKSVLELHPKDAKAIKELNSLLKALF